MSYFYISWNMVNLLVLLNFVSFVNACIFFHCLFNTEVQNIVYSTIVCFQLKNNNSSGLNPKINDYM